MNKQVLTKCIWVLVILSLLIPGGFLFRHYQADVTQAYERISSASKVAQTPCGPIEYSELGTGAPMLMVHGAGDGFDQGAFLPKR